MLIRFKKDVKFNYIWDVQAKWLGIWWPTMKHISASNSSTDNLSKIYISKYQVNMI